MSMNIICSLTVRNKSYIVRQIGTGILGPKSAGLFHFKSTTQVKHLLDLQNRNLVSIETPIPTFISVQLGGGEASDAPVEPVAPAADPVVNLNKKERPIWYLSWEEVERKEKKELMEWFEQHQVEGLSIPKSKNATATKEIVHAFLAGQFEDHVAPKSKEEEPTEDKEPASEE